MQQMIRSLLEVEFRISAIIGCGDAVLAVLREEAPDALILDVSLPGCSGLQLLPMLRKEWPDLAVVLLTTHQDDLYRKIAAERGADAYVEKHGASETLVPVIHRAIARRRVTGRMLLQR